MRTNLMVHGVRLALFCFFLTGVLLLSLNDAAWATSPQQPLAQTIPEPTSTPTPAPGDDDDDDDDDDDGGYAYPYPYPVPIDPTATATPIAATSTPILGTPAMRTPLPVTPLPDVAEDIIIPVVLPETSGELYPPDSSLTSRSLQPSPTFQANVP